MLHHLAFWLQKKGRRNSNDHDNHNPMKQSDLSLKK